MEEFTRAISDFLHDPQFWSWFWLVVGAVASFWNGFYFFGKPSFSEKELDGISPHFLAISAKYQLFMIGWFFLVIVLIILSADDWILLTPVIPFKYAYRLLIPSYGIAQGMFALLYGIYPQGKSLSFIYAEYSFIRRVAIFQIVTSIIVAILMYVFMPSI